MNLQDVELYSVVKSGSLNNHLFMIFHIKIHEGSPHNGFKSDLQCSLYLFDECNFFHQSPVANLVYIYLKLLYLVREMIALLMSPYSKYEKK